MIIVNFPEKDHAVFFGDPASGADCFDYRAGRNGYWSVRLERLLADEAGRAGLRVLFEDHHRDIQKLDDEAGR